MILFLNMSRPLAIDLDAAFHSTMVFSNTPTWIQTFGTVKQGL